MTSVGHAPPHENEDGVADKYRPVANGFHKETSHFENDCNGFIIGNGSVANESTKLLPPICDTSSVINSKHDGMYVMLLLATKKFNFFVFVTDPNLAM